MPKKEALVQNDCGYCEKVKNEFADDIAKGEVVLVDAQSERGKAIRAKMEAKGTPVRGTPTCVVDEDGELRLCQIDKDGVDAFFKRPKVEPTAEAAT